MRCNGNIVEVEEDVILYCSNLTLIETVYLFPDQKLKDKSKKLKQES